MGLFLQILGAFFLLLLVGGIAIRILLRLLARKVLAALNEGGACSTAGKGSGTPARIHLVPVDRAEWKNEAAVRANLEVLEQQKLPRIGVFQVREMAGLLLAAYACPERGIHAHRL